MHHVTVIEIKRNPNKTLSVTLGCGNQRVNFSELEFFDVDDIESMFDDWFFMAISGEVGYTHWNV